MSYITDADPYLHGNSKRWKNWQSNYKEPKTCISCENRHGQIYPYHATLYEPEHLHCRCKVVPMRTKKIGTATEAGWDGADAWLMYRGKLPDNYITKKEAKEAGWIPKSQNLAELLPGKQIGGDIYLNNEGKLPQSSTRVWYEADFDFSGGYRKEKRILYSNDGLIFVSHDHMQTFYELVK